MEITIIHKLFVSARGNSFDSVAGMVKKNGCLPSMISFRLKSERGILMFKKTVSLTLVLALVLSIVGAGSVFAESNNGKLGTIENKIEKKEEKVEENKKKEDNLKEKISTLEDSIAKAEAELNSIRKSITKMTARINKVTGRINALENKIEDQEDSLNIRLRTMYKDGNLGIIQVLLGSVDIQDFMNNFKLIKELHKSDVTVLKELKQNREKVKQKKEELNVLATNMKSQESKQQRKQKALESDKSEVAAAKAKVEAENEALYADIDKLEAESSRLQAEIASLSDSGKKYTGNGVFTWPFPGYSRVSSEYGSRIHPVTGKKKFHSGLDLAGPSGSPIVAAESGTVISAGWNSGGYGNMVIIDHGGGLSTLYGHNSSLSVSVGQSVKRGQTIALCGSTGLSTGPHLHFEVRKNGGTVNPRNYI